MAKGYAITTIMRRVDGKKETVPASTKTRVSIFDATEEELEKLINLNAARKATKEEIALAKVQSGEEDAPTNVEKQLASEDDKAPASGATGDPQGKPKGATKASSKDEEI